MSNNYINVSASEFLEGINIDAIEVVTLSKLIRNFYGLNIIDSVNMARLIKTTFSLGVTRGKVVNNS